MAGPVRDSKIVIYLGSLPPVLTGAWLNNGHDYQEIRLPCKEPLPRVKVYSEGRLPVN